MSYYTESNTLIGKWQKKSFIKLNKQNLREFPLRRAKSKQQGLHQVPKQSITPRGCAAYCSSFPKGINVSQFFVRGKLEVKQLDVQVQSKSAMILKEDLPRSSK